MNNLSGNANWFEDDKKKVKKPKENVKETNQIINLKIIKEKQKKILKELKKSKSGIESMYKKVKNKEIADVLIYINNAIDNIKKINLN